jgi:hypothetical protein
MNMIECQQWIGHIGWTCDNNEPIEILNHQLVLTSLDDAPHVELKRMFDGETVTLMPPSSILPRPLLDDDGDEEERQYRTVMHNDGNQLALVGFWCYCHL